MDNDQIREAIERNGRVPDSRPSFTQDCKDVNKKFDERFHLVLPGTEYSLSFMKYRIRASTGEIFEGITDSEGYTERIRTEWPATLEIEVQGDGFQGVIGDGE